jgi:hypothetical protein
VNPARSNTGRSTISRGAVLLAALAAGLLVACGVDGTTDDTADRDPLRSLTSTSTPSSPTSSAEDGDAGEANSGSRADEDSDQEARQESSQESEQPRVASDCDAYADSDDWCTDGIGDYDCEGGSGNGPNYAPGPITVVDPGTDPFGLDRDGDGTGCDRPAPRPEPEPEPEPEPDPGTDPRFDTCREAIDNGYGPYYRGQDPEYDWYRDSDGDGVVCES